MAEPKENQLVKWIIAVALIALAAWMYLRR
jgi:hypothetical protein